MLWQALGLGWGLAAVGTLIGLGTAGQGRGGPGLPAVALAARSGQLRRLARGRSGSARWPRPGWPAWPPGLVLLTLLVWVLLAASAAVLRARQRQRVLLSLLAHGDPKVPGALVVDTRRPPPTACPACARPS